MEFFEMVREGSQIVRLEASVEESGLSLVFVLQLPPNLARQFSETKSLKGCNSQIHNDVTMTSMTSSLLC